VAKTVQDSVASIRLNDGFSITSDATTEITIVKPVVHVLEMEDVLFHLNSAIMMPDNPQSAQGGSQASGQQKKVSGLRALALVFRHHQLHADQRLLLAGHADRSGDPKTNFAISDLRAQNVLFLLQGKREPWADVCYLRQKIEDYQQILTYYAKQKGWDCDPQGINNQWNQKTEKAINNFITLYDYSYAYKPLDADLIDEVAVPAAIKNDGQKRWPKELWRAVFDLYQADMINATIGLYIADNNFNGLRNSLTFVDPNKQYVACGESFPISANNRTNYRSQQDRRVEILFFDPDEIPTLTCPADVTNNHSAEVCPLYNSMLYNFQYIDPASYFTAEYHLKFTYFDRIYQASMPLPEGLSIRAWKEGAKELPVTIAYDTANKVYIVTVQGLTNSPREQGVHFTFETLPNTWIYSEDTTKNPVITQLAIPAYGALTYSDRLKYYDLPQRWDGRNWQCSVGGTIKDFSEQMMSATTTTDPVVFNLDMIVCLKADGSQKIEDTEYDSGTKTKKTVSLSTDSHIALLYLDHTDQFILKIHSPHPDAKHYSAIVFNRNCITNLPDAACRLVYFNSQFYDIEHTRTMVTSAEIADPQKKYILGARAAVVEDSESHVKKSVQVNLNNGTPPNDYAQQWCGNFELHFLFECGLHNGQMLTYLIVYWNCRVVPDATNPGNAASIANWNRDGMINSMLLSNRPYFLEKKNGIANCVIRPFCYYEAKINNRNGKHDCTVGITTEDVDWMLPETARFCDLSYAERPAYYGPDDAADVDGVMAKPLMSAHEMGHATGLFDDYLYDLSDGNFTYSGVPSFDQPYTAPGGPYNLDNAARMRFCRRPRMRDIWHFVNWINDDTEASKPLNKFLHGSKFKMTYAFTDPTTAGNRTIEIDLDDPKFRDVSKAAYSETNFSGFGTEKITLYLYKLGGGETAETLVSNHIFDGILAINIKIAVMFVGMNANADRQNWIITKLRDPLFNLNRKFYLLCNSNNAFKKTLITVTPYFIINHAAMIPANAHFGVTIDNSTPQEIITNAKNIRVKRTADGMKIVRYFFGLPTNTTTALQKTDFNSVATWIGRADVANGVFSAQAV
jgi:hypothetical protein